MFLCAVLAKDADVLKVDEGLKDITCSQLSEIAQKTDRDVWNQVDDLEVSKARLGVGAFNQKTQAMGLRYEPQGILFDKDLRRHVLPVSHTRFDVLHVCYSNGTWGFELIEFLRALRAHHGILFAEIKQWCG